MSACHSCGAPLAPADRFCGECGSTVESKPAKATPKETVSGGKTLVVIPRGAPPALRDLDWGDARFLEASADQALLHVRDVLAEPSKVDAICLVGADHDLPMVRLVDQTGQDANVPSDNPYGARHDDQLLPEVPVGRIPSLDPDLVARVLGARSPLHASWEGGLGVSAAVWERVSRHVLEVLAGQQRPTFMSAPSANKAGVEAQLLRRPGRVYFNVHGTDEDAVWVGEASGGGYPEVLRPAGVAIAPHGVVVSEACYGAAIERDEPAISLAFLEAGAGAFIGSTIIAWGPARPPPGLADRIVLGVYAGLDEGLPVGAALLGAKRAILEDGRDMAPQVRNTVASFVLYGHPLGACAGAGGAKTRPAGPRGSVLAAARGRMLGAAGASPLDRARQRLAGRMSVDDFELLSSGRVALAALPAMFRSYDDIRAGLESVLGLPPQDARIVRWRSAGVERSTVIAELKTPWGKKLASVVLDPNGRVTEVLAARGQ